MQRKFIVCRLSFYKTAVEIWHIARKVKELKFGPLWTSQDQRVLLIHWLRHWSYCGEKWFQNWTQSLVKWCARSLKEGKMACGKRGEGKLVNAGNSRVPANSACSSSILAS